MKQIKQKRGLILQNAINKNVSRAMKIKTTVIYPVRPCPPVGNFSMKSCLDLEIFNTFLNFFTKLFVGFIIGNIF